MLHFVEFSPESVWPIVAFFVAVFHGGKNVRYSYINGGIKLKNSHPNKQLLQKEVNILYQGTK
jgi:hypothetical protein